MFPPVTMDGLVGLPLRRHVTRDLELILPNERFFRRGTLACAHIRICFQNRTKPAPRRAPWHFVALLP
jgi:hypothetical protein